MEAKKLKSITALPLRLAQTELKNDNAFAGQTRNKAKTVKTRENFAKVNPNEIYSPSSRYNSEREKVLLGGVFKRQRTNQ